MMALSNQQDRHPVIISFLKLKFYYKSLFSLLIVCLQVTTFAFSSAAPAQARTPPWVARAATQVNQAACIEVLKRSFDSDTICVHDVLSNERR